MFSSMCPIPGPPYLVNLLLANTSWASTIRSAWPASTNSLMYPMRWASLSMSIGPRG